MTPDDIEQKVFSLVRRGYDPEEVDNFLKEVAAALAQARLGVTPPPEAGAPAEVASAEGPDALRASGPDDFERLGEEVAAILRQAHESVATLRHRAEAEAALIRQVAERESALLREEADGDRQAAAIALEAAQAEADRVLADVQRQADRAAEAAAVVARQRTDEVIEAAKLEARGAVAVQRNVRGRLEITREDIDHALDHLVDEDTELFADIDLTDDAMAAEASAREADEASADEGDDAEEPDFVPPPGQGPPSPAVPPPLRPPTDLDLPYDESDDDLVESAGSTDVVDLTDSEGEDDDPDGLGGVPPVPPPPPGFDPGGGAGAEPPLPPVEDEAGDDPLAQMVKNAVENALKRRKGDSEPTDGNGA